MGFVFVIIGTALCTCYFIDKNHFDNLFISNFELAFLAPGILSITGGVLSILSRKVKILLLLSGIIYLSAGIINAIIFESASIFLILCLLVAPINIYLFVKPYIK